MVKARPQKNQLSRPSRKRLTARKRRLHRKTRTRKRGGPARRGGKLLMLAYTVADRMTCDDGRPCQRCIKRSIGHLCHDEPKGTQNAQHLTSQHQAMAPNLLASLTPVTAEVLRTTATNINNLPLQAYGQLASFPPMPTTPLPFASAHMGNEYTVISDFLESVDGNQQSYHSDGTPVNTTEKFYLTAADPSDGSSEDRLTQVINAKFEAGLLKPYNYVKGYARLQQYMESHMSSVSRQRILSSLSQFRPSFRAVAQSLTDIDLVLVEEAFERLLLDYDRVFSSMGIPACLWRRTGEIYKGNKGFASLVGLSVEELRDGRMCIYELMAEASAVNYWEKYGNIAFDAGQKAVLTSCLLRNPDPENTSVTSCCFAFTIRRDKYNIPSAIVGNFLPIQLSM